MGMSDLPRVRLLIRRAFMMSNLRREALKLCKVAPAKYRCSKCGFIGGRYDINIDHISPVTRPEKGFEDWNTYVARTFCSINNLQGLCKPCHKAKTLAENVERKKYGTGVYGKTKLQLAARRANGRTRSKKVLAIRLSDGTQQVFSSARAASKTLQLNWGRVQSLCNGGKIRKSCGGYTFEYIK